MKSKKDNRKISLAITNYNRDIMTFNSFKEVIKDKRINEILILDDTSDKKYFFKLESLVRNYKKVKLIRNKKNLGMSANKNKAISLCKNEWVIIFDSDNIINSKYIDTLFEIKKWDNNIIYMPDKASDSLNYNKFSDCYINKNNLQFYINIELFGCMMNTCNYFVNRDNYIKTYEYNCEIKETDTIWFNYLWIKSNKTFYIVKGLEYYHLSHEDSGFLQNAQYNFAKQKELLSIMNNLEINYI